jgi:hypothetical protein
MNNECCELEPTDKEITTENYVEKVMRFLPAALIICGLSFIYKPSESKYSILKFPDALVTDFNKYVSNERKKRKLLN